MPVGASLCHEGFSMFFFAAEGRVFACRQLRDLHKIAVVCLLLVESPMMVEKESRDER